jgi:hypothetical protein
MKAVILLMLAMIVAFGCGKKADPVPWSSVVPKRIVDLRGVSREGHLLLEWTAPKENTDKSALLNLAEFKILRSEGNLVGDECKGCGQRPKVVHEMKVEGKAEEARGKKMSVLFEDLEPRKVYVYTVVSVNRRGHPGSPSNPVEVYWDFPPQQPTAVRAEPGDKKTDLSWDPVEGASGYNVYRREEGGAYPLTPLNRERLRATRYSDLGVENEKKYYYSVRALRRVVKTDVEGKGSLDVAVIPTDLIPPGAPAGLVAVALKEGVELTWIRNKETDLSGYNVYRRKVGEQGYTKLNDDPVPRETYLDKSAEVGQEYDYVVTAVDKSPRRNESPYSEETRIKYIYQ